MKYKENFLKNVINFDNIFYSKDFEKKYEGSSKTIHSFGSEWNTFKHENLSDSETAAKEYFDIFPLSEFKKDWIVVDVGCGTGRWTRRVAPHVKCIYGVDPSDAINVFEENTSQLNNTYAVRAFAENLPFDNTSVDFVLSLGVLHHIQNTKLALLEIQRILKKDGVFLFYLYYNLDNRNYLYKLIYYISNILRFFISKLPSFSKNIVCEILSLLVYFPLVSLARMISFLIGKRYANHFPLSSYRNKNYYFMRNDCRDRFGTPLEKRYSKEQIQELLVTNGFSKVVFSDSIPYWHGYAIK